MSVYPPPAVPSAVPARRPPRARPPVAVAVERTDRHRLLTVLALAGLAAGALMAAYGLPPVDLHDPLYRMGIMCPFCGATRAVRFAMLGEWGQSLRYNPIGVPLVLGAGLVVVRSAVGAATRRWLTVQVHWSRPLVVVVLAALLALWVNQQLHVDLIGP